MEPRKLIILKTQREITWKCNSPSAPHLGGSWERLIQSAKSALRIQDLSARRRILKISQVLANQFWRRLLKEYAPYLIERRKWSLEVKYLREGNVVDGNSSWYFLLVIDGNSLRSHWPMGRIFRPLPGKDGVVSTVLVKTSTEEYVRSVTKLCVPLGFH